MWVCVGVRLEEHRPQGGKQVNEAVATPYICVQCGVQFSAAPTPPEKCPICEDERQAVHWDGQQWTTLSALNQGHRNVCRGLEPGLTGIVTEPKFAIGQQALLVQSHDGNVLWDCLSLINEATMREVQARGGLAAVAVSHPHFYDSMVEWSNGFGGVPIYLHEADREWVMRPDPSVRFWAGDTEVIHDGLTLIRCGGHFPGSAVLHWAAGAEGRGALLASDTLHVTTDREHVTFMRSFPNWIPLRAAVAAQVVDAVEKWPFDRVYGGFPGLVIQSDGKERVRRSLDRYTDAITERGVG